MTVRSLALALSLPLALAACQTGNGPPAAAPGDEVHSDKTRDLAPQVSPADQAALVAGGTDFAMRLHQALADQEGNLVYSPLSISTALAMLYAGAHGQTETQMAAALGYTLPQERLHPAMNWLDLALASRAAAVPDEHDGHPFELKVVNRIWGQTGFAFLPAFLDTLAVSYAAGLRLFDFTTQAEPARQAINDWVAEATHERVKNLLPQGSVTPDTRLVLTNAVYFLASWKKPFAEASTQPAPFGLLDGTSVTVPMMHKLDEECAYAAGDGYVLAELPYVGDQVAMTLLVPDTGRFDEIEGSLTGERLATLLGSLHSSGLDISLPRFQFELAIDLAGTLQSLGMTDAFDVGAADFSGIDGTRSLAVSAARHKAFIKVDEQGTEAAAATAVVVGPPSVPTFETVNVDRPFLFFLRDRSTGAILFVGRVVNPAAP